jgi:urate oxidase
MPAKIIQDNYGKSRVRLMKLARAGETHELQNITVAIALEGDFDAIHIQGDNSLCLPTDTMKNTVYVLAGQTREIEEIEVFGHRLAAHFLANNPQVSSVRIDIAEHFWKRMKFGEEFHPHSFVKGSGEKRTAKIVATRDGVTIESGVDDLIVLKTTGSGFAGYIKDDYTTLPETTDRIFSTAIKAVWRYKSVETATGDAWRNIRQTILKTFAGHDSLSVQHTLYAIGEAVLEKFSEVEEIYFSLPNIHCLPVDIARFGLTNDNRIFVPTDEPHGLIEARLAR